MSWFDKVRKALFLAFNYLRNAMRARYRAVVGGLVEVILVFTIAGIISIGAYKQYKYCIHRSQVTNTACYIRSILHNLDAKQAENMKNQQLKSEIGTEMCSGRWNFLDNKLSIKFHKEDDARAVLLEMPELDELNQNSNSKDVVVVKKWET